MYPWPTGKTSFILFHYLGCEAKDYHQKRILKTCQNLMKRKQENQVWDLDVGGGGPQRFIPAKTQTVRGTENLSIHNAR